MISMVHQFFQTIPVVMRYYQHHNTAPWVLGGCPESSMHAWYSIFPKRIFFILGFGGEARVGIRL
jgi:hypothetical protein